MGWWKGWRVVQGCQIKGRMGVEEEGRSTGGGCLRISRLLRPAVVWRFVWGCWGVPEGERLMVTIIIVTIITFI